MKLRQILKDPSLMSGMKIVRDENIVKVGDHEFVCSTVDVAKKLDARLTVARFAWGMTTRGKAQSRQAISRSWTGWTQHN